MNIEIVEEGTRPEQLELFEIASISHKGKTVADAFEEFHGLNPHVYRNLRELAYRVKRAGRKKTGIAHLYEILRWEYSINTKGDSEYKLPNNFKPYYARVIMRENPELAGLFDIRRLFGRNSGA